MQWPIFTRTMLYIEICTGCVCWAVQILANLGPSCPQRNILIGLEQQVLLLDIGMSPVHDIEGHPREYHHLGVVFDYFVPPEVQEYRANVEHVSLKPSVDIFAMAMLFLYLLLPINTTGEPSVEFHELARQLHDGTSPKLLPKSIKITEPIEVMQGLWDLIRSMVTAEHSRPTSVDVLYRLKPLSVYLRTLGVVVPLSFGTSSTRKKKYDYTTC